MSQGRKKYWIFFFLSDVWASPTSRVKHSFLLPGDRVLVKKIGIKGKHKLADLWESNTYIVTNQPMPDIHFYEVKEECEFQSHTPTSEYAFTV